MTHEFVNIDKYARIDAKTYDKLDAFFNAPDIPCSSILITDCTNNNLLLATKIVKLCGGGDLHTGFEEVKVGADFHDTERKHGLYSKANMFFVDLIRIRYDDYKYFIVVLESIISQRRIDADVAGKLIIVVNNYNHVLNKYMTMFQIFIEKYAGNAVFIFIGSGNKMTYMEKNIKAGQLCFRCRVNFLKLNITELFPLDNIQPSLAIANDILYYLLDGDALKAYMIVTNIVGDTRYKPPVTGTITSHRIECHRYIFQYILKSYLPIYNSIYELLCNIAGPVNIPISKVLFKGYILLAYPGYNLYTLVKNIIKIIVISKKYMGGGHILALTDEKMIKLHKISADITGRDVVYPVVPEEPVLLLNNYLVMLYELLRC